MPSINKDIITCKACGNTFQGNYCNLCGQKVISRFSISYLWQGLHEEIFEIDRGLWLTFKELWLRPGKMVLEYIGGNTKKYYGPLKYLIFWTALYLILQPYIAPDGSDYFEGVKIRDLIFNSHTAFSRDAFSDFNSFLFWYMTLNTNYYFLGLIPFISIASFLIYRSYKYNLTEVVIIYTYFCGHFASILFSIFLVTAPINSYWPQQLNTPSSFWLSLFVLLIPFFYFYFKLQKQFFKEGWLSTILKSVGALYGGIIPYILILFLLFNLVKVVF